MTNLTKAIHWHIFHKKIQLCLLVDWWSLPPGDRLGALASPPRSTTQTTSSTVGGLPVRWEEIGWEHPNHRLPRSGGWTREDAGFVEIRGTRLLLGRKRAEAPLEGGSLSAGLSSWLMLFSGRIKHWSWNRVYFSPRCFTTCCCRYSVGQKILVGADITANHKGYFEFRVCPQSNPNTPVSEDCLQRHLLQGDGGTRWDWEPELGTKQISMFSNEFILIFPKLYRYYIKSGTGRFSTFVKLPERLRCEHCVLQVFFQNIIRCEKCVIDHVSSGDMLVEITGAFVQMARERWDSMMKRFSWQRKVRKPLFPGWVRPPRGVSRLCRHFNRSWYLSILFGNGGYHKIVPYPTLRVCHGGYHKIMPYQTLRVCPTNTVSYKTVTICTVLQTSQRASWGKSFPMHKIIPINYWL